jgi:hypothetical protein
MIDSYNEKSQHHTRQLLGFFFLLSPIKTRTDGRVTQNGRARVTRPILTDNGRKDGRHCDGNRCDCHGHSRCCRDDRDRAEELPESWDGPACTTSTGRMSSVGTCGCRPVRFHGGHEFNFHGETATLYSEHGCTGTPYQVFEDTQACGDFGWRSIHIDCQL